MKKFTMSSVILLFIFIFPITIFADNLNLGIHINTWQIFEDDLSGNGAERDTNGHITENMKKCVRASDTVARFGGDEFVIIMPDIIDQASVTGICEKLNQSLNEIFDIDGVKVKIGASVGVTLYPDHANSAEALLELADKTMYELKNTDDPTRFKFAAPNT